VTTKTTLLLVALSLVIVQGSTNANELAEPKTDLYTLFEQAVTHDPELSAARAARMAASEALPQARSGLLPNLSMSAEQGRYERQTEAISGFSSAQDDHYSRQVLSANLRQPVFDLQAWYRFRAGQSLTVEAETEYTDALQSLSERLVTGYFRVLRAQSRLDARQSEQDALSRQKAQIEKQLQAGIASRIDLLETRAEESRVTVELVNARSEHAQALRALEAIAGVAVHEVVPLRQIPDTHSLGALGALVAKAESGNPQLLLARQEELTARHNASAARSAHAPTLSLELSAQRDLSDSPDVTPPGTGDLTTDTASVALRLELPIYSGGQTSSRSRESHHLLDQARENFRLGRTNVMSELESNFEALQSTRQAINAGRQAVDAQRTALEAAKKGQKAGVRDLVDILRARREQFTALDVLNEARYDYVTTLARIYRLTGELGEERIRQINQWLAKR